MKGQALLPPGNGTPAFRGPLLGFLEQRVRTRARGYVQGLSLLQKGHLHPLILQMVANQQQMPQIPAIVLVRPDSEPGQFKLDIQRGPAFRPNKGQHIGPVQVLHAKSPKNSNAQYRKAQDGGQNHQIVGQQQPLPYG